MLLFSCVPHALHFSLQEITNICFRIMYNVLTSIPSFMKIDQQFLNLKRVVHRQTHKTTHTETRFRSHKLTFLPLGGKSRLKRHSVFGNAQLEVGLCQRSMHDVCMKVRMNGETLDRWKDMQYRTYKAFFVSCLRLQMPYQFNG